jgi:predicted dinucleotide-binding enzyme
MKIAIMGSGMVGQALAGRLAELGHDVTVGTRDIAVTMARIEPNPVGIPPFSAWSPAHPDVALATFGDAAAGGELIVNATAGSASLEMLRLAGARHLAGKILVDVANVLDFSQGMPPTLFVKDTDSLAEQIQREFPDTKVVKTLNTMTASLMVNPRQIAGGAHTAFISGDDTAAKDTVTALLTELGHTDIIDLGGVSTARGPEMLVKIWLELWDALGTYRFGIKIVR